jgi:cell division protein FtsN
VPQATPETETLATQPVEPPAPAADAPATVAPTAETPAVEAPAPQSSAPTAPVEAVEAPAPVKAAEPAAPAKPAATPQAGGAYVVQLLALRDEASAKKAWAKVVKKHNSILGAHALDIEEADLGAKGVWYRVRAAGFASKSAAASACAKLKSAGQDCIVKKR